MSLPKLTNSSLCCPCTIDGGKTIYPSVSHLKAVIGQGNFYQNPNLRYVLNTGQLVTPEEKKALGIKRCVVRQPKMSKVQRALLLVHHDLGYRQSLSPEQQKTWMEMEAHLGKMRKARKSRAAVENQSRPEVIAKMKATAKITNALPETKKRRSEGVTEAHKNLEFKVKRAAAIRKAYEDPELKRRLSENQKRVLANTPPMTCPHCGKTGARIGMKRYHFDNCKHKEKS